MAIKHSFLTLFFFILSLNILYASEHTDEQSLSAPLTEEVYIKLKDLLLSENGSLKLLLAIRSKEISALSLIDECSQDNCPLNRIKFPHIRSAYEATVCHSLKTLGYTGTISYTSLGSADLYFDLALITQFAYALKGKKQKFIINLIDKDYANCLESNQPTERHKQFWQFGQWLEKVQKDTECTIRVCPHSSVDNYLKLCSQNPSFKSHIVIAMDVPHENFLRTTLHPLLFKGTQPGCLAYIVVARSLQGISALPTHEIPHFGYVQTEELLGILPATDHKSLSVLNRQTSFITDTTRYNIATFQNYSMPLDRMYQEYALPTPEFFTSNILKPYLEETRKHMVSKCYTCNKEEAVKICSNCKCIAYCSPTCQKEDWRRHKKDCKKASVDITMLTK
jgi:hypothetical protein